MFAYPFRQTVSGSIAQVDERSDEGVAQLIGAIVLTRLGERPMFPTFGISDPLFTGIAPAQVAASLAAFGPDVRLVAVNSQFRDSVTQDVEISYAPIESSLSAQS